ncbi:UPF0175 family protein [Deltaproteobacteria bacterium TL4]
MEVSVEIPDQYLNHKVPQLIKQLKLNTAIEMYRSDELSAGAACEFAGTDRFEFLVECRKRGIEIRTYEDEQELKDEVSMLKRMFE